jgi:hypothetical protein
VRHPRRSRIRPRHRCPTHRRRGAPLRLRGADPSHRGCDRACQRLHPPAPTPGFVSVDHRRRGRAARSGKIRARGPLLGWSRLTDGG